MNYREWNDAIAANLFNETMSGSDVYLYLTKQEIIQIYKDNKKDSNITDECIWKNFITAINFPTDRPKEGIPANISEKKSILERLKDTDRYGKLTFYTDNGSYPLYITYLITLILPLIDTDEQNPNIQPHDYYKRAKDYFKKNNIRCEEEVDFSTNSFKCICIDNRDGGQIDVWLKLQRWSERQNIGRYTKPSLQKTGNYRYINTVFSQALISETEVRRLKLFFAELNIEPYLIFTDEEIAKFYTYPSALNIIFRQNNAKKELALKTAKNTLITKFRQEYQKWDGSTYTEVKKRGGNSIYIEDKGVIYNIYLTLRFPDRNDPNQRLDIRYVIWYKNAEESPDELHFKYNKKELEQTQLLSSGWSEKEYTLGGIDKKITLTDEINNIRAIYSPQDIILFQKLRGNIWVSKSKYETGGDYFIVVKEDNNAIDWLNKNARRIESYEKPELFALYKIEDAQSSYSGNNLLMLKENEKEDIFINDDLNIIVNNECNKTTFPNLFPLSFEISGVTNYKYKVFAEFDQIERKKIELEYIEEEKLWQLRSNLRHALYKKETFQIVVRQIKDEVEVVKSKKGYTFLDPFICKNINGSLRDKYGDFIDKKELAICEGLDITSSSNNMFVSVDKFGGKPSFESTSYLNKDYILYALSSIGVLKKKDFNNIVETTIRFAANQESNEKIEKYRSDLLNEYDRLGYLNHDYNGKEQIITINKPTLILLPVRHIREERDGTTQLNPIDSHYRSMLTGARSIDFISRLNMLCHQHKVLVEYSPFGENTLLPQQIILLSESIEAFKNVAKSLPCDFNPQDIYAASLFRNISSVEDYTSKTLKEENVIFDYPSEISNYKSIKILDFRDKLQEKKSFDPELDLVTYSPNTYQERTILWYKRKQYPIDKYWGYFVVMSLLNKKHILFDSQTYVLRIPATLRFPKLYARAFSLITGMPPYLERINGVLYRCYQLANSPHARTILSEKILNKLKQ